MSNPFLLKAPFCYAGSKNTIQVTRQSGQDPEDATLAEGFPPITMVPTGGIPPKGEDMNGALYEISSPVAHYCRGDRILFDAAYAAAIGGYNAGAILASNDYQRDYISLVDNNLADPNGTNTTWAVYAGQGSVPVATSTITGTVKLINSLASLATDAALTAAQGKVLNDAIATLATTVSLKLSTSQALGIGQSWQDLTSSRSIGTNYTNNTSRPIQVCIATDINNAYFVVNGVSMYVPDFSGYGSLFFIIPPSATYRLDGAGAILSWAELR